MRPVGTQTATLEISGPHLIVPLLRMEARVLKTVRWKALTLTNI